MARFRFDLASKGGGRTDVGVVVDEQDWPHILSEVAQRVPGAALFLAEATKLAIAHNEAELGKVHGMLGRVSDSLEEWESAANARYFAAAHDDADDEVAEMSLASDTALAVMDAQQALTRLVQLPGDQD